MTAAHDPARIDRLEETAAFTDRSVEELSGEVRLLNQRLHDAGKRIARLEEALERIVGLVETQAQDAAAADAPADPETDLEASRDQHYRDNRPPHASGRAQGY